MLPEHVSALRFTGVAETLLGMMMPILMRRIQLGKDRGQGRIDVQLGRAQLLMQGLPLIFGGAIFALALEGLELLLEARLAAKTASLAFFN